MISGAGYPVINFVPMFFWNGNLAEMALYKFGATAKSQTSREEEPKENDS